MIRDARSTIAWPMRPWLLIVAASWGVRRGKCLAVIAAYRRSLASTRASVGGREQPLLMSRRVLGRRLGRLRRKRVRVDDDPPAGRITPSSK
jgi:hypothetical protein